MPTRLTPVRDSLQVEDVAQMAVVIWQEYYLPILGQEQVSYMLKNLQSAEKMVSDIATGTADYFIVEADEEEIGYAAIKWQADSLFLSKLYLLKEARGHGHAYALLQQFRTMAAGRGKNCIELSVNKYNHASISFYEKTGFQKIDAIVSDIGGGFVMDDYIYRLAL